MKIPDSLSNTNIIRTFYWNYKFKNFDSIRSFYSFLRYGYRGLLIFPAVHVKTGEKVSCKIQGKLELGSCWKLSQYRQSELKLQDNSHLKVNGEFRILTGFSIAVNPGAELILGSGYINNNLALDCFSKISIGENVAISKGVTIRDSDNHMINGNKEICKPIQIGNHVWIGMNVTILKGVSIGDGAVIAANSLVNRDVPPHCLAGGVPAKVLKTDVVWE